MKISISPEHGIAAGLSVGESAALSWSFPKNTTSGVSFESSDPAIAEVDPATGAVKGVSGESGPIGPNLFISCPALPGMNGRNCLSSSS